MTETTTEKLTLISFLSGQRGRFTTGHKRNPGDPMLAAANMLERSVLLDTPACGEPVRIWANMDPTIDKGVFTEGVWYAEPGMLLDSHEYITASALRGVMAEAEARGRKAGLMEAATWYRDEGWKLDEDAVPEAIRTMIGKGDGNG